MKTELKCSTCKKVTKHYTAKNGEVRCLICGTVNKTAAPKKNLEVMFESEFDDELNVN